jgi:hypothetical protein
MLRTGHKTYPITDYVNLLTSKCDLDIISLMWTIVASIYKIPPKIRKLLTGHEIYLQIDNVDLEWASATLTLEVGVWLLRMTHHLIITNICAKLFQIPSINDKVWRTDRQTDRRTEPISISPFFLRKGRGQKEVKRNRGLYFNEIKKLPIVVFLASCKC